MGISSTDPYTGTAVGYLGAILRTTDGGVTWISQSRSPETAMYTYFGVSFIGANTGTVVGGWLGMGRQPLRPTYSILRTNDRGESWTSQSAGLLSGALHGVCFADQNTGTAVGEGIDSLRYATGNWGGIIMRTTNGRASWTNQSTGITSSLHGVFFNDANTGTVVGGGNDSLGNPYATILRTTNGGTTWIPWSDAIAYRLFGVCYTDPQNGIAVGDHGTILRTTDGGSTWTRKASGTTSDLRRVFFAGVNVGAAVGSQYDNRGNLWGTILHTTDGGDSWKVQMSEILGALNGVYFTDENTGTAVGAGRDSLGYSLAVILRTTDGGTTWATWRTGATLPLYDVSFTDANNGTAVGEGGTILHTTTGGATWVKDVSSGAFGVPIQWILTQNYPNPFNPSTTIKFELPKSSDVRLSVYDLLGREVSVLVNERRNAGVHEVRFDASGLSSGVYFYRLQAGTYVETRKLVMLR